MEHSGDQPHVDLQDPLVHFQQQQLSIPTGDLRHKTRKTTAEAAARAASREPSRAAAAEKRKKEQSKPMNSKDRMLQQRAREKEL